MSNIFKSIQSFFSKVGKYLSNFFENSTTSKRHFKPIMKLANTNSLKIVKVENSSLSESGFSFFETGRGYSCSKLEVVDLTDNKVKGCYLLVTENFGIADGFNIKWVDINSIKFSEPYSFDEHNEPAPENNSR